MKLKTCSDRYMAVNVNLTSWMKTKPSWGVNIADAKISSGYWLHMANWSRFDVFFLLYSTMLLAD